MKFWRWIILGGALTIVLAAAWIVWQLPQPVEMATYVPAETLLYLEVNDLPQVLQTLTKGEAWQQIAAANKIEKDLGSFGWLSSILANANLGSTNTIIFGRAQIAVALMSVGTTEAGENLKIRPQFAVVIETKSGRAKSFVETEISDFARRQFGRLQIEKKETEEATWTIFRSTADERNLFAAVHDTVAIVGNDEQAVKACLETKSGKRQSLAQNANLAKMRLNLEQEKAFAFGFVTSEGVKQLSSVAAIFAAGQLVEDKGAMSLLAQSLPSFAEKSITAIGWTARAEENAGGQIEDRYYVQMPPDLVARLRAPLSTSELDLKTARFLPNDLQSITFYNLKNPQTAWRGVILAMMSKLDALSAAALSQAAGSLLAPYGVARADDFLGAIDAKIMTARLTSENDNAVGVVGIKEIELLKNSLQTNGERKSELVDNYLLLGDEKNLQLCRAAREQNQTFQNQPIWLNLSQTKLATSSSGDSFVLTLARDETSPIQFIKLFSKDKTDKNLVLSINGNTPDWVWTTTETRLVREGFERRISSPFGLIGTLATNLAEK